MDEDGFREFMAAQNDALLRMAYLICGSWTRAEELVQEALYRTFVRWRKVSQYDRPEFYVRKIMLRDQLKHVSRRREDPVAVLPERTAPGGQDAVGDRDELWRALRALPPRARAVVVLRYWEDRSEQEVADLLDISVGTVKSQASRGLTALRGRLDSTLGEGR